LVGIVLIAAGFAVVTGAEWARWFGIAAASIGAITFLPWIYYQPLWTVLSVALAVLVIYALGAYGGRQFGERIERVSDEEAHVTLRVGGV
jgi:hypothetical protein